MTHDDEEYDFHPSQGLGRPHPMPIQNVKFWSPIELPAGGNKKALMNAMEGHILAQAELMGAFTKP